MAIVFMGCANKEPDKYAPQYAWGILTRQEGLFINLITLKQHPL